MTDIQIPDEALEAGARAQYEAATSFYRIAGDFKPWAELSDTERANRMAWFRAAFEAVVKNWPGLAHYRGGWEPVIHNNRKPHLILPLEASNG